ncbi:MAG: iron ABC transporter permease [Candidatus Adiutrix sp.]|jgi:iron complex transport system permease protein|nr:iron ABC transporter permease [Candidatus Adiutrix sp.]
MNKKAILILLILLAATIILVLPVGRYPVSVSEIWRSVSGHLSGRELSQREMDIVHVFLAIRLPRILAALLVGSALSVSGAVYQSMFMNPLVSPGILGVLAGASCGAAVGIVAFSSWPLTQLFSFLGGLAGVGLSLFFSCLYPKAPILALLVGGLVSSSFFMALTSIFKYLADPARQLPELVYWLMGTLSRSSAEQLQWVAPLMLAGLLFLTLSAKTINALSQGEDEARALGIESGRARLLLIGTATLVCSLSVILSGIIQWVGLVIPHVLRLLVGPDNRTLLPATALGGALFLLLTDTLVRSIWTAEFPLGIITALICMPLFAFSLWHDWRRRP